MDRKSDYFMGDQENQEKEEENLKILNSISHRKRNSKYLIQKFEKFNPKPKNETEKIDSNILTAENKVKTLLSSFLKDFQTENEKKECANINTKLKRKKTKVKSEKIKNKSTANLNPKIPICAVNKNNTTIKHQNYKNENKNKTIQSPTLFNKGRNINVKSLFFHHSKDNLPKFKKKYQKKLDLGINNILMGYNIEYCEEKKRKNSADINLHLNEINLMSDEEKNQNKSQEYTTKKTKKLKKKNTKFKSSIKSSIKTEKYSSLYSEFEPNSIENKKYLKLPEDIHKKIVNDELLKESKNKHSYINTENSNIFCCSNFTDKAKSESGSPKKYFNISVINKKENKNDYQSKETIFNRKRNLNKEICRTFSYFSSKISGKFLNKKKYKEMYIFKNLKEQIKNSIILRPEELNLTYDLNYSNSLNNFTSFDKEKVAKSKLNTPSSRNNTENNLLNSGRNVVKKLNKKKSENQKETINNKKNDSLDDFSDKKNENQNQKKNLYCPLTRSKTKKEKIKENFRVLINKKLVYDSLDDEEIEEEYSNYIHPDSLFIKVFDNIVSFIAFSLLIYLPYYLASTETFCKDYKSTEYIINIIVEIIYFLDLIFEFFKAYYNFEEQLIINNISIIKKYLESWFLLDLISTFPIYSYLKIKEPFCQIHNNIHPYGEVLHNLHYLIILNKLLKIVKFNFINHNFTRIFNKIGLNSLILIHLLRLISVIHFISCINIFISRNSYPNWIIESDLENSKFYDLYISSIYSLLTSITTVGYGDITCHSFTERIFQIFLLITGSMAYSWLVSSFSNYVQKCNEKYIDFENKRYILDEIRFNYPKMPNNLYEKVLRYLKYKNYYEKKDKNMIFDCLPIGLKNNLVYEMYKPIIKNFIFFRNFGNFDFIVRIILAFKPILAYKNDVLLNEGDFVDDIFFIKKGILSVQIPINIQNPEEYIDKYLYGDILEQKKFVHLEKQNFYERKNNRFTNSAILQQENNLSLTEKENLFNKRKRKEKENKTKKNIRYIKIVSIRENEHFGDVLMFLDQRSPLRVKVTSKKAELFFLKKIDVLTISNSYPNIWRRINKKSVFNFERIKNSIPKIVELYCKFKGFITNKVDKKITRKKSSKKNLNKKTMSLPKILKMNTLKLNKLKRNLTQQNTSKKTYTDKYFPSDFSREYKNIKTNVQNFHKNAFSTSDSNNNDDDSEESSENSDISDNDINSAILINKKLINNFVGQCKDYTGAKEIKENYESMASTIKEESEIESSIIPLKKSNITKNKLTRIIKNSNISNIENIKKNLIKSNFSKNKLFCGKMIDNLDKDKNKIDTKEKEVNMKINNKDDKIFHNKNKHVHYNTESTNKRKSNIADKLVEDEKLIYKNKINDEFNINEKIKIPTSENLLSRSISKYLLLEKKNNFQIYDINNIRKQNSEKILYSDKPLSNCSNSIGTILDKINSQINNNNKLDNHKKYFEKENLIPDSNITEIQITSIYNNLHNINKQYYLNKELQEIVKQLLEKDIGTNFEKSNKAKISKSTLVNKSINKYLNKPLSSILNNSNNTNILSTNLTKKNEIVSNLIMPLTYIRKNRFKTRVKSFRGRSSTYIKLEKNNESFKCSSAIFRKKRKKYETNIGDSSIDKVILINQNTNRIGSPKKQSYNISRTKSMRNNFIGKESLHSLNKYKNAMMYGPNFFNKKRKSNLLSTINFNIAKSSQNLNNPDAFYSSYFQSLLQFEKQNSGKIGMSPIDFSAKFKRNKK